MTNGVVYGVDISPEMIEIAKRTGSDIIYITADLAKPLELEKKFDLVICSFLLHYANCEEMLN